MEIALTGGICCGKSTLANELAIRGWHIIDTDAIAHRLMQPGQPLWKNVVDAFGEEVLSFDKSIDRKVLGKIVYADPALRVKLNEITHPVIRSVWQHEREQWARLHPSKSFVVMIPLLFECKLEKVFRTVWSIGALRASQVARLKKRGFSEEEATLRIKSQLSVEEKMARADVAFWNEGTLLHLTRQLEYVLP